jgi:hypothetical protein
MPDKAIALFDANPKRGIFDFKQILIDHGWLLEWHPNCSLMTNPGSGAVWKLFDHAKPHARGYHLLATQLAGRGDVLSAIPHLPTVYRYKPGVALVQTYAVKDKKARDDWAYTVAHISTQIRIGEDYLNYHKTFFQTHPRFEPSLDVILELCRKEGLTFSIDEDDVLQRADGTMVMIDPVH